MDDRLLLTIIGDDRPGLTEALAAAILGAGGNWLEASLSRLGGKYVGAVLVDLPPERIADLREGLARPATAGLKIEISSAIAESPPGRTVELSLTSQDRLGIVHEVSLVLARLGANIVELETSADDGAWSGSPIFRARASLTLPDSLTLESLQEALEQLSGDLMVELDPN